MDVSVELAARSIVIVACLLQLVTGLAVLAREYTVARPAPVERNTGPLALVNFAGIALFILIGLGSATTGIGNLRDMTEPLDDAVRIAGVAVLCTAGILVGWSIRVMGKHLVSLPEVRPDTELITSGPFALVRHPLFLAILLLWVGGALALLSAVLLAGLAVFVPAFYLRGRAEEQLLTRHFGDAYTEYSGRVPMLWPGVTRRRP